MHYRNDVMSTAVFLMQFIGAKYFFWSIVLNFLFLLALFVIQFHFTI